MTKQQTALAVLGTLVAGGLLGACTTTPTASAGTPTTTTSPASSATITTTSPATTSSTAATTTTTTTAPSSGSTCQDSQLKVTEVEGGGAAGTIELPFTIANVGASSCVLDGYPTISLVSKSGSVTPTTTHSGQGEVFQVAPSPITLAPHSSAAAAFAISYTDIPVGSETSCPQISGLGASLPGPAGTFNFTQTFYPCGAPNIGVSAIVTYAQYKAQFDTGG